MKYKIVASLLVIVILAILVIISDHSGSSSTAVPGPSIPDQNERTLKNLNIN